MLITIRIMVLNSNNLIRRHVIVQNRCDSNLIYTHINYVQSILVYTF